MATIDLGKISFVWKGAYAGGTAYTVKDVVSYSGASYICKVASTGNLPTNATYWDLMSVAGVDGTDLTSTLTTQGDLVYRDGSGLQRLGFGTSGQFLKTQGTGANPVWASAGGKTKKTHWWWDDTQGAIPSVSSGSSTGLNVGNFEFTATTANPHFILDMSLFIGRDSGSNDNGDLYVIAYIEEGGTLRYPFGFKKTGGFRANATFRALTGDYMLEDTDAGHYGSTDDWSGMRWSYPGVMGNQASTDAMPVASSDIAVGDTLTFKCRLGGSAGTWYNRTKNQTNSISRSWFKITEIDGTL